LDGTWFLIRCIDPPSGPLPAGHQVVLDRGPFALDAEIELLRAHGVDVVVSKNSGGQAAYAKIAAARALGLPAVMVRRPPPPAAPDLVVTQAVCEVCAVSYDDVVAVAARLPTRPRVLSLDPSTLGDVLADVTRLAEAAGVPDAGRALAAGAERRLDRVRAAVA